MAIGGVVYRVTSPDERSRAVRFLATWVHWWVQRLAMQESPASIAFGQALRERTRLAPVTVLLVATNVLVFAWMALAPGSTDRPDALIGWGASLGPRTTNGEWWRIVTATFVHAGLPALVANMVGLVQPGRLLERLVGPLAFAGVYVAAGVFAILASLPDHPLDITAGASGAVCGVYGLLLVAWVRGMFPRSALTLPNDVIKAMGPATATFVAFNMLAGSVPLVSEAAGLLAGVAIGTALVRRISTQKPTSRCVRVTFATAAVIAVAAAASLRGIVDVRPELRSLVSFEDRTTGTYAAAMTRFRAGRITDRALAAVIKEQILPQLNAERTSLKALGRVPPQHERLIAEAKEYLRLREESWRLRLDGLTGAGMTRLREAEARERSARELIDRLRPT
jgi:membrane associated rhomboid family serine protease